MTIKQYLLGVLAIIGLFAGGYAILQYSQGEISVGGDLVTPIAGQTYILAGAGIASNETSFTLTSFTITQTGYKIQDSDMSDIFYVTFEPGSRSRQEIASCTTVTQNSDGTATISGCTRGLLPITPYTASTSLAFAHAGGSTVIFSDPPQLFNQASFKDNDETITGSWLFPTPLSDSNAATKAYVDALVSGTTTLSNDRLIVAGTAGETMATNTLVYLNPSTQRWNGVSTASTTTFDDRFIGLTQGSGTNGTAINGGVLLKGRHTLSSGLTAGGIYYASTATGTISTATSAQPVGIAVATNILYFDPVLIDVPHESANNTFTGDNTFSGVTTFTSLITGHASTTLRVYTASSTWTKPAGLEYITVWVCGGGGGSGGADDGNGGAGGGGGGGGCAFEILDSTELAATSSVAVIVGLGGTAGSGATANITAGTGGTSQFGNFVSATGGSGGVSDGAGGAGGVGSNGDINFNGQGGNGGAGDGDASSGGGSGGSSMMGGGGNGVQSDNVGTAGGNYGGGGGGASTGTGGADRNGGAGAQGVVIITEYF